LDPSADRKPDHRPGFRPGQRSVRRDRGGKIVGFYALVGEVPQVEVEHLWVLPETMGIGAGRALFYHALQTAAAAGAVTVKIEADPLAEGFYKRIGARWTGEEVYELDGQRRVLPLLVVELPGRERPD
jgi:GNAT superfamily N-acetyltransferase